MSEWGYSFAVPEKKSLLFLGTEDSNGEAGIVIVPPLVVITMGEITAFYIPT